MGRSETHRLAPGLGFMSRQVDPAKLELRLYSAGFVLISAVAIGRWLHWF